MAHPRLSPLTLLLGCIFFFTTQVFAVSAVLGVDFGTEYITAALVKPGIPLEIVLTKDSRRKETSAVAFKPARNGAAPEGSSFPERLYGSDAMSLAARFPSDVYPNLKTILGLPTDDAAVQEYLAWHPALQLETHDVLGSAAFKSNAFASAEEQDAWLVEELLAMQLQSIQKNAEMAAGSDTSVRSIVLTVPPYYTVQEKRAIRLAADLAGLKVLSLISDGMAVGLNYATTRQFPNIDEGARPEHHLVFDMGAGSTKATVMRFQSRDVKDVGKFNKTVQEVAVLGAGWDKQLGGDLLNSLIVDDMVAQFIESKPAKATSIEADAVKAHGRAISKLNKEAERLRQILSANSDTQGSFEGLYEDVDFKYKITRDDFEKMAEPRATGVATAVREALEKSGLDMADIDSVILHGGASRTPFVQKILEDIAGSPEKIRTNVNADEAAVLGAGFRAADLSPSFRVKEIRTSEGGMYASGMRWTNVQGKEQEQRLWSPISPQGGAPKEITFANLEDIIITFYQQVPVAGDKEENRDVAQLSTNNLTDTVAALKEQYSCTDSEIQFKLGLKLNADNGEVEIARAAVECEAEVIESFVDGVKNLFGFGKKDQKPLDGEDEAEPVPDVEEAAESSSTTSTDEPAASDGATAESTSDEAEAPKKKEIVSIPVKATIAQFGTPSLSADALKKSKDRLQAFAASDKARFQREEALNQLEGFTYKVRDLLESQTFVSASTDEERSLLEQKSGEASEWLYSDEAETASRDEFNARYKELHDVVTKVQQRADEADQRPKLVSELKEALSKTDDFVKTIRDQIQEYNDWQASASAEAETAKESEAADSEAAEGAASGGDFEGLEDDEPQKPRGADDDVAEKGPVPPLYTQEDVDVVANLKGEMEEWLSGMEAQQNVLPATADPVLLVKDLRAKREKLDKAGMDLAMKGVKKFDKRTGGKKSETKKEKPTQASEGDPAAHTIDFGKDGKVPTEEEIQELLRKIQEKQEEQGQQGEKKEEGEHVKDEL